MDNLLFLIVSLFSISIFIFFIFFGIYIIILFVCSRGFSISPTVTSSSKSIREIIKYINKYLSETKKNNIRILDIGSGYGKMLFRINKALKNQKIEYVGYEISNFSYKISKFLNKSDNITLIKDDINNLKDFDFDIVITFILAKQQKLFLNIYRKFKKGTIIIANSLAIPFEKDDNFELIKTIKVCYRWNIYIYKKN